MILNTIHNYFFSGALKEGGSWGGPACSATVTLSIHLLETLLWNLLIVLLFIRFKIYSRLKLLIAAIDNEVRKSKKISIWRSIFENGLIVIHFGMCLQVLYYKINKRSLVNLFQPCHLCLLMHGIALSLPKTEGCVLSVLGLPLSTGGIGALFVPDHTGLDQPFERLGFWVQHYLISGMPIYLLSRFNFAAIRVCGLESILLSNWIVAVEHWIFYEFLDLYGNVNVQFMLCPPASMSTAIASLPWWLTWPSYRTLGTIVLFFLSVIIAYLYLLLGRLLAYLFGSRKEEVEVGDGEDPLFNNNNNNSSNEDSKRINSYDRTPDKNSGGGMIKWNDENSNSIGTETDLKKNR